MPPSPTKLSLAGLATLAAFSTSARAQVDLHPATVKPAAWERFALRAINQTDTAFVGVRLAVPEAVMVLGIEALSGWEVTHVLASDTSPQVIEWSGGELLRGEFLEFAFFGRLPADSRKQDLVFPVHLTRATGSEVVFDRASGDGAAPTVQIVGTTAVTGWAALALAGVAVGIAVLALALAASNRRAGG